MEKFTLKLGVLILLLGISCLVKAQNVSISESAAYTPDPSAMLDVYSTDKGLLVPRMTKVQRNAIVNPANGLLVFDIDYNCFFYYFDNGTDSGWTNLSSYRSETANYNEALFAVVNSNGDTVFAVYPEGVHIIVGDGSGAKGNTKGGFAVSGVSAGKGVKQDYFIINQDSARIYVEESAAIKGNTKGGFAVSGVSAGKGPGNEILRVTEDSVRIFFNTDAVGKGNAKGGFAVSGVSAGKGVEQEYFVINRDSTRFYVEEGTNLKGNTKGGFAVSGVSAGKGSGNEILRVTEDSVRIFFNTDAIGKGNAKGGFAVSGVSAGKGIEQNYLLINQDSARIYVEEAAKGSKGNTKGGFAVSGVSAGKGIGPDIMKVTKDSTRIYVDNPNAGFSIGNTETGTAQSLMKLTKENYFIGHESGISTNHLLSGDLGKFNSFYGYQSGKTNSSGYDNVFVGYLVGKNNTEGHHNVFIGSNAAFDNTIGADNVMIGANSGRTNTEGASNVFVGDRAGNFNITGHRNVFLGKLAGAYNDEGSDNVLVGTEAGYSLDDGYQNVFLGINSGRNSIGAYQNVFIGESAGIGNSSYRNVFVGYNAGAANTSYYNIFIGFESGMNSAGANYSTFVGHQTGRLTTGQHNSYFGAYAGAENTLGADNTFIGYNSGALNVTGIQNTYVGTFAGGASTGSSNVFIGYNAGNQEQGSNKLYIDNSNTTMPLIFGEFDNNRVGINQNDPLATLDINGSFRVRDGSQALGKVLMSDAIGFASWASLGFSNISGSLAVNQGGTGRTTLEANKILVGNGNSAINQPTNLHWDNTNSRLGIGTSSPSYKLSLGGDLTGTLGMERISINNFGMSLHINAGGAYSGGLNKDGGKLYLYSGISTGTGSSDILFLTATPGSSGSVDRTPTTKMIILGNGNIGIGNNNPSGKMEITSNSDLTFPQLELTESLANDGARLMFKNGIETTNNWTFYGRADNTHSDSYFNLYYSNFGDVITANGIGNVGIGVNPLTGSKLQVSANSTGSYAQLKLTETAADNWTRLFFNNAAETNNSWTVSARSDNTHANSTFNIFYSAVGDILTAAGNGNLGIGMFPATNKLEVNGNASKATAGDWLANSDKRIKTDISDISNSFETILKLRPVKFKYTEEWKKRNPSIQDKYYYNFIAQEYQNVFPESVKGSGEYLDNDTEEILQIDSYNAQIVTIKAVQELIHKTQVQQEEIEKLERKVEELIKVVEQIHQK